MTDAMADSKDKTEITENDVIGWLRQNPDFLIHNPDVCDLLTPPKAFNEKGVADFQHFMVQRLRADRDVVLEEARDVIETSRANMNNQYRIFRAVLMLLEAHNFEEFIRTITIDLTSILDVDITALAIETDSRIIPHINIHGVKPIAGGSAAALFAAGKHIILESGIAGDEAIYGSGAGLVKSQTLVRLTIAPEAPEAILAFGSRNPQQFAPGQGTELISFLGHVIERCMRIWLDVYS